MAGSVRVCWHWIVLPCLLAAALLLLAAPQRAAAQSIDDGLVGYWRFDEGSGATSADSSGSGNTATLVTPNSFTAGTASTDFANPFAFSSHPTATSYATAPGVNIDSLPQLTVAFWVRVDSLPDFFPADLVALKNKVSFTSFRIDTVGVNLEFVNTAVEIRASMPVGDGAYHHVAATYDGKYIRLYVDGALRNTFDINNPAIVRPGPLALGQGMEFSSSQFPLDGALDDVRVYNRVLSGGEILALTYNCGAAQGLPASECRSLAALFRNTNGQDWTNHAGWLLNNAPCTWAGVLCDSGHVFALSLPQNQLVGSLNADLGNLPGLVVLNLANNHLTGTIPFEVGNLPKLQTLDLYSNQLGGQVPFTLGALSKLTTLRLHNNQLRGLLPPQLANLSGLITLDLGYNLLSAIDSTLLSFLAARQPGWAATQTVPPTNLQPAAQTDASVALTWDAIPYTADGGYYQVLVAPQATGVYTIAGVTGDKNANSFRVAGLTSGQTYSFLVRTYTPHHGEQQNDLMSDSTDPVTATPVTLPVTLPVTITIALDVQPDSRTNFVFTGTLGAFTLDDITPQDGDAFKASKTFVVPAGVYTVTEYPVSDYLDVNAGCSPPAGAVTDLANHQIIITAAGGANVTCTFVEQRAGQIIAGKYNDRNHNHVRNNNEEWLNGWQMEMHSPFTPEIGAQLTSGEGRTVYKNLLAGTYTVCELRKTGWFNITPNVQDATYQQPCYTFNVAPGQAVWVRFGNSTTPLMASQAAGETPIEDIVVCDLPPTDDNGNEIGAEREPWEEEEGSGNTVFLPVVER